MCTRMYFVIYENTEQFLLKQLFPKVEVNSGTYFTEPRSGEGEYFSLSTDTEENNCFSICPISEWIWRISVFNALK